MTTVRTRFAPSPTGQVHIGNIRAAIYNWLYARHLGGQFLLRIEDTDRERSTPQAIQTVLDAMDWLGLNYDETPVYQSRNLAQHQAAAEKLLAQGVAYKQDKGGTGRGEAVLFRMPGRDMVFHDEIKGELRKEAAHLTDFVILRSDGTPTFHLANVVDDVLMNVTHVIRGDDHIENTYRHVALFEALGAPVPKYAHLPMIVNAQGKPYSKRDGAAFVGEFREKGFLPDALFNYLTLLGWSPGDDREVLPREEIVRLFDLAHVKSSPAQMDLKKLEWMNGEYVRRLPETGFLDLFARQWGTAEPGRLAGADPAYARQVALLLHERIHLTTDIVPMSAYFFKDDFPFDEGAVRKRLQKPGVKELLQALREKYTALEPFDAATTEQALRQCAEARSLNAAELIHPLRVAVSGLGGGPSLFHMLEVLGRDRVIRRLDKAMEKAG